MHKISVLIACAQMPLINAHADVTTEDKGLNIGFRLNLRGAFGKFLAWSFISVTDIQNLLWLVSF